MSKTNNFVFIGLLVVAWIIFVGLCIEAGGLIVNFVFSLYYPNFVDHLYQKLDLSELFKLNRLMYYVIYILILSIALLKAKLFYIVITLMHKIDLANPFSNFASKQILLLSYYILFIGFLTCIGKQLANNTSQFEDVFAKLNHFWGDSQAYILMGAIIYIIAIIFKKGVELQNENDLTV